MILVQLSIRICFYIPPSCYRKIKKQEGLGIFMGL